MSGLMSWIRRKVETSNNSSSSTTATGSSGGEQDIRSAFEKIVEASAKVTVNVLKKRFDKKFKQINELFKTLESRVSKLEKDLQDVIALYRSFSVDTISKTVKEVTSINIRSLIDNAVSEVAKVFEEKGLQQITEGVSNSLSKFSETINNIRASVEELKSVLSSFVSNIERIEARVIKNIEDVANIRKDVDELKQKVPPIKVKDIAGAMFDPMAGKSSPFDTIHALYSYLRDANVRIALHTKVKRVISKGSRVLGVEIDGKIIEADTVVVAAGSDSRDILKGLNVGIPITNLPRHALITEAYRHILKPLVID